MTVRLVRADSAGWEVYLSVFWSITLTFFGIYLGAWIASGNQEPTPLNVTMGTGDDAIDHEVYVELAQSTFGTSDKVACVAFGVISLALIGAWAFIRYKQRANSLKVPYDRLQSYGEGSSNG